MENSHITVRISGKSITDYRIVIAENASESVLYAADELISYLHKTIGKKPELVRDNEVISDAEILVGVTNRRQKRSDLKNDDFEIAASEGRLSLCGANDRATIYAVYTYLEKYVGWRFFDYDAEVLREKISRDICAGETDVERPALSYRDCMYRNTLIHPEIRVKLKLNAEHIPENMGGCIEYNGFVHTFGRNLLPENKYFSEHPEYFALRDGKRTPSQPCLSNPDTLRIVTENALKSLRENYKPIISISQNDNCGYCTCDKCRQIDEEEGSPSGAMLRFVNAVAEEIEKEFPDVIVDTLAYQYTRHIPEITRPRHNVAVRLCSYECCFRHPLYDELCQKNIAFRKDIEDWSKICDKLYIWDYVTDFSHYVMPLPNISILRNNVRFFAEHSATGILEQGAYNGLGADFCELKTYILSKLLWNPYMTDVEYEYHIDDFLDGFYGQSSGYIKKYLQILNETTYEEHIHCYTHPHEYFSKFMERIDEILALLNEAVEAADNDEIRLRVRRVRITALYVSICSNHDARKEAGGEIAEKLMRDKKYYMDEFIQLGIKRSEWFNYYPPEKTNFDLIPENW